MGRALESEPVLLYAHFKSALVRLAMAPSNDEDKQSSEREPEVRLLHLLTQHLQLWACKVYCVCSTLAYTCCAETARVVSRDAMRPKDPEAVYGQSRMVAHGSQALCC